MILTTTNQIPRYSIDKYKGLVNANQVIGVNILSEWIASITDVVGGTSGTFRRKLDTIYSDVLNALSLKAKEIGANAIIGIKIDFDEISANGKSMFMLTAQGTAVLISLDRLAICKKLHELKVYLNDGLLSQEEYERECERISTDMENIIATETKAIELEKLEKERKIKESEERLKQLQQKDAQKHEMLLSLDYDKQLKDFSGFHIGDIVEIIDTEEFVCIDGFTQDGNVVCMKGDDILVYSITEIRKGNF